MHITFKTSERDVVRKLPLPQGTTLVESDSEGNLVASWVIKDESIKLVQDFVELNREWRRGEAEEFAKDMTRERVFDFFLHHDDARNRTPQRKYSAMSSAEYSVLKFIRHAGTYIPGDKKQYNMFKISLNSDSDLNAAEQEITWALDRIIKAHPERNSYELSIFEHTLSEHGIYSLEWDGKTGFKLMKCTYGRIEQLKSFDGLRSTLEYIAKHHYYQKKTDGDE